MTSARKPAGELAGAGAPAAPEAALPASGQPGDLLELVVDDVAQGGWCVAREPGGRVVLVRHALPGERVLATVTEVTSRFARAEATAILEASPDRVEPPCPHARPGGCGGCDWQHAGLAAQRRLKGAVVSQQLRRIAGLDLPVTVEPMPGEADGLGWRTRVRFAVGRDGTAGLRKHRSHEVLDVGECPIAHPGVSEAGVTRHSWPGAESVQAVTSPATGEHAVMVTPATRRRPASRRGGPARGAAPRNAPRSAGPAGHACGPPRLAGGTEQGGRSGRYARWAEQVEGPVLVAGRGGLTALRGRPYLEQQAAGRGWRVSAEVFWQVHPAAADVLAGAVTEALRPQPGEVALDLYCGAGLFAGLLAAAVGPGGAVIGAESDPAAVRDARHNLRDHPLGPDPPRRRGRRAGPGGLGPGQPGRPRPAAGRAPGGRCWTGCWRRAPHCAGSRTSPATRPRWPGTSRQFTAAGWRLDALRAFDAFPMTHHVECVATLTRD